MYTYSPYKWWLDRRIGSPFFGSIRCGVKIQFNLLFYFEDLSNYPECSSYAWLKDANRNEKDTSSTVLCDIHLIFGWYRFGGQAGIKMPTSCVPGHRCGTQAAGWMNGVHPTVSDGKVTRKVCYHYSSDCCEWSNNIEVLNCGYFFIYKPSPTPLRL